MIFQLENFLQLQKQTINISSQGLASYTISGLAMNHGQSIEVTKEFKVTAVDGSETYINEYVNSNGLNYENGIPSLASLLNAQITVENIYRYTFVDGR